MAVLIAYHACNMFPVALVCILFLSCTDRNRLVYQEMVPRELAVRALRPRHHRGVARILKLRRHMNAR